MRPVLIVVNEPLALAPFTARVLLAMVRIACCLVRAWTATLPSAFTVVPSSIRASEPTSVRPMAMAAPSWILPPEAPPACWLSPPEMPPPTPPAARELPPLELTRLVRFLALSIPAVEDTALPSVSESAVTRTSLTPLTSLPRRASASALNSPNAAVSPAVGASGADCSMNDALTE